jgi:NAD(P) transhydrogenase subunit alpha
MIIGIPNESSAGERRVAATPQSTRRFVELGYQVTIAAGAGAAADFPDDQYRQAGATVVATSAEIWSTSDIVLAVAPPSLDDVQRLKAGATLISFLWPARNSALVKAIAARGATAFGMDCVPRVSRAQKLDTLSSMANVAGYRAVVEAANVFGRLMMGQVTAAGKVPPAKVLIIGAGVAGLAAAGTAKSLGAIVRAFDTRAAVKDQVRSMGAEFLELDYKEEGEGTGGYAKEMSPAFIAAEMALFARQAAEVDIIITTALIPGKPAPRLITAEMVRSMRPGSVIVDMAAEQGGNCELTEPGRAVEIRGVTILGYTDLPSRMANQSSALYGQNLVNLLADLTPGKDGRLVINTQDEVIRGTLVVHDGQVVWPPPPLPQAASPMPAPVAAKAPGELKAKPAAARRPTARWIWSAIALAVALGLAVLVGQQRPNDSQLVQHLTVFVLACIVGWQVIWNVTPALHTPLMSVTNAISGIIVVGAMLQMAGSTAAQALAGIAVLVASINVVGGFLVTQRMLGMFRKQG